jgi:hypothetical protein
MSIWLPSPPSDALTVIVSTYPSRLLVVLHG